MQPVGTRVQMVLLLSYVRDTTWGTVSYDLTINNRSSVPGWHARVSGLGD